MDLFSSEQRVSSAPVVINAHRNELVCLATNQGGSMVSCDWWRAVLTSDWWRAVLTSDWLQVATASTKGTLIRIWDTAKRVQLVELRRGADQVTDLVSHQMSDMQAVVDNVVHVHCTDLLK